MSKADGAGSDLVGQIPHVPLVASAGHERHLRRWTWTAPRFQEPKESNPAIDLNFLQRPASRFKRRLHSVKASVHQLADLSLSWPIASFKSREAPELQAFESEQSGASARKGITSQKGLDRMPPEWRRGLIGCVGFHWCAEGKVRCAIQ